MHTPVQARVGLQLYSSSPSPTTMVVSSQRPSSARAFSTRVARTTATTPSGSTLGVRFAGWGAGPSRFSEGVGATREPEIGPQALGLRPRPPPRVKRPVSPLSAARKARHLNPQLCDDDGSDDVRNTFATISPSGSRAKACACAEHRYHHRMSQVVTLVIFPARQGDLGLLLKEQPLPRNRDRRANRGLTARGRRTWAASTAAPGLVSTPLNDSLDHS